MEKNTEKTCFGLFFGGYTIKMFNHGHNILRLYDFGPIVVISNKHSIYELPRELRNKFRLKKLGNIKKISKPLSIIEL